MATTNEDKHDQHKQMGMNRSRRRKRAGRCERGRGNANEGGNNNANPLPPLHRTPPSPMLHPQHHCSLSTLPLPGHALPPTINPSIPQYFYFISVIIILNNIIYSIWVYTHRLPVQNTNHVFMAMTDLSNPCMKYCYKGDYFDLFIQLSVLQHH
jgi:hypothetical protein